MSPCPAQAWSALCWPGCVGLRVAGPCQEPRSRADVFWSSLLGPTARGGRPGTEATVPPCGALGGRLTEGSGLQLQQDMARWRWLCGAWLSSCSVCGLGPGAAVGPPRATGGSGQAPAGPALASHPRSVPSCGARTLPGPRFSLQKGFLRLPRAPASGQGWPWLLMNPLRPSPRGQCETGLDLSCVCDLSPGRGAWGCVLQ